MAAGNRNSKGKPSDYVRHYGNQMRTDKNYLAAVCGNKRAGYVTDDISDVTCIKCTARLLNLACTLSKLMKPFFPDPNK
jgi:hypothetical protein